MFCNKCESEIKEDNKFCTNCGNKVIKDEMIVIYYLNE